MSEATYGCFRLLIAYLKPNNNAIEDIIFITNQNDE
jgi:hypothetical protein